MRELMKPHMTAKMHQTGKPMPSCAMDAFRRISATDSSDGSYLDCKAKRRLPASILDVAVDSVRQHSEGQHPENVEDQFTGKRNVREDLARKEWIRPAYKRPVLGVSWSLGRPRTSAIAASPNPG